MPFLLRDCELGLCLEAGRMVRHAPGLNRIAFLGPLCLVFVNNADIAQVIFHETSAYAAYEGKYQNQEDKPVLARG